MLNAARRFKYRGQRCECSFDNKSHQRQGISIIGKFIWARYGIDEVLGRRNSNLKEIFFLTLKF